MDSRADDAQKPVDVLGECEAIAKRLCAIDGSLDRWPTVARLLRDATKDAEYVALVANLAYLAAVKTTGGPMPKEAGHG